MKRLAAAAALIALGAIGYRLAGGERQREEATRIESDERQSRVMAHRTVERDRRVRPGGGDPRREE